MNGRKQAESMPRCLEMVNKTMVVLNACPTLYLPPRIWRLSGTLYNANTTLYCLNKYKMIKIIGELCY